VRALWKIFYKLNNMTQAKFNSRNNDLAKIHIAKAQLGLDDAAYRSMLWTVAQVSSSANLDHAGRAKVLAHLKNCGFKPAIKHQPPKAGASKTAMISKIGALLTVLNKPWAYADGMAKKMFKLEKLIWCTPQQLHKIIAALEYAKQRAATPCKSEFIRDSNRNNLVSRYEGVAPTTTA
jgi:phage gp16-like protein